MLSETHCHLQFNAYKNDRDEVVKRCLEKGMILNVVGTQKDTSRAAVELAEKYENVYATVGLHPVHLFPTHIDEEETSFASREESFDEAYYVELAKSKKVIAVGEAGIDLFHLPVDRPREEVLERQKQIFIQQYNFAKKYELPLVIHVRDAHNEMIEVLGVIARKPSNRLTWQSPSIKVNPIEIAGDPHVSPKGLPRDDTRIAGVVHCYTSNWEYAQEYLKLGLYIGFTGVITFPPKQTDPKVQAQLLEVVKSTPLERILIETDAPYLAPQAYRGERCEPWMVEEVAKKVAELRGLSVEAVIQITEENARRLLKI